MCSPGRPVSRQLWVRAARVHGDKDPRGRPRTRRLTAELRSAQLTSTCCPGVTNTAAPLPAIDVCFQIDWLPDVLRLLKASEVAWRSTGRCQLLCQCIFLSLCRSCSVHTTSKAFYRLRRVHGKVDVPKQLSSWVSQSSHWNVRSLEGQ